MQLQDNKPLILYNSRNRIISHALYVLPHYCIKLVTKQARYKTDNTKSVKCNNLIMHLNHAHGCVLWCYMYLLIGFSMQCKSSVRKV